MVRLALVLSALLSLVSCAPEPLCTAIDLDNLTIDPEAQPPRFQWSGRAADLQVTDSEETPYWSIRCNCRDEEERPDRNSGCGESLAEYEFRHCLQGPVHYGETPAIETLLEPGDLDASMAKLEPEPLISGTRYEVAVTAFCDGGGFWANSITRRESFVAP